MAGARSAVSSVGQSNCLLSNRSLVRIQYGAPCGHRIMAITSAFQADDAGSIPAGRSIEDYGDSIMSIFLRYLSSVKISIQQLFMLVVVCLFLPMKGNAEKCSLYSPIILYGAASGNRTRIISLEVRGNSHYTMTSWCAILDSNQ